MHKMFTQGILLCLIFISPGFFTNNANAASITDFIIPPGFSFNRDLVKGSNVIPDVFFLQNLLNMSTSTQVSGSGAGANDRLTSYYGIKTQSAVKRFQTIFKSDIDYEKSISTTTGATTFTVSDTVVDEYTRKVLNKLIIIYSNQLNQYKGSSTTTLPFASTTVFQTGVSDTKEEDSIEKTLFKYSPNGVLLKIIGGSSLVDKVYSYTPSGMMSGGGAGGGGGATSFSVGGGGAGGTAAAITPFGGFVTSMVTCTCSFNLLLYVKDPRGPILPLIYQPGATILYRMYTPTAGVNVLGRYTTGGQCLIYAGTSCSTGGTPIGTMIQLGTSAL